MPTTHTRLFFLSCTLLAAGCGGGSSTLSEESMPDTPAKPTALYIEGGEACAQEADTGGAEEALTPAESGQGIAVVELFYAGECTGAGGQYILAREVGGDRDFWLGAHACYFYPEPAPTGEQFGVLRYSQTAALFQISPDVCVGFPGEPPGAQTDATTVAIAVFASLEDAKSFKEALDDAS